MSNSSLRPLGDKVFKVKIQYASLFKRKLGNFLFEGVINLFKLEKCLNLKKCRATGLLVS